MIPPSNLCRPRCGTKKLGDKRILQQRHGETNGIGGHSKGNRRSPLTTVPLKAINSTVNCLRATRHFLRTPKGGPPRKKCLSACTFHNLTKNKNASPICHNSLLCRLSDNYITPEILRCSPHIQIFEKYIELFVCPPHPHGAEKLRGWFSAVKSFCG